MDAVKVFSICIKYLVDRCLKNIRTRVSEVTDNDLYWVLTVPSTSNDGSKQFMREAAQKVGLKNDRLTIALESEVALLSCMHLPIEIFTIRGFNQKDSQLPLFSIGQQIMVAVFKENTVNTTVYEIVGKGQLKELISTSGGACGDALVDEAFEDFIKKIVGNDVYNTFKISCIEDWLDLQHNFKVTKRFFKPDRDGQETILIPVALSETYMAMTKNELQIAVDKVGFAGKVKLIAGKIRISRDIMSEWYKESCENTVKHLKELFKHDSCIRTVNIVLVGDFAESRMLQKALTDAFPNKRFIVPEATGLAVLNGAVLYGHDPITIVSRVAKFSYGVLVFRDFIEGQHPKEKMEQCGDRLKCKDVFGKHITKGQDLVVGEAQASQRYIPSYADQESFVFDIYASPDTDPKFITDDGCTHIGRLEVEIPGSGKDRAVWVGMVYGGTEIIVLAKDEKTGKEAKTTLDFL